MTRRRRATRRRATPRPTASRSPSATPRARALRARAARARRRRTARARAARSRCSSPAASPSRRSRAAALAGRGRRRLGGARARRAARDGRGAARPLDASSFDAGDGQGFELEFAALGAPAALAADAPAGRLGGMAGYDQPCRVRGTVRAGGRERAIDGLGQRGHAWGDADWERIELARTVTAWTDGACAALTAIRPAGARDHADGGDLGGAVGARADAASRHVERRPALDHLRRRRPHAARRARAVGDRGRRVAAPRGGRGAVRLVARARRAAARLRVLPPGSSRAAPASGATTSCAAPPDPSGAHRDAQSLAGLERGLSHPSVRAFGGSAKASARSMLPRLPASIARRSRRSSRGRSARCRPRSAVGVASGWHDDRREAGLVQRPCERVGREELAGGSA